MVARRNGTMGGLLSFRVLGVLPAPITRLLISSFFAVFNDVNATSSAIIFGPSRLMLTRLSAFSSSLTA